MDDLLNIRGSLKIDGLIDVCTQASRVRLAKLGAMHERYRREKLFGTARHLSRFPDPPWQTTRAEQPGWHKIFEKEFECSVPRGVDLMPANENVHVSSVLVLHRAAQAIHVDDALMHAGLPLPMRLPGYPDVMLLHPASCHALENGLGFRGKAA